MLTFIAAETESEKEVKKAADFVTYEVCIGVIFMFNNDVQFTQKGGRILYIYVNLHVYIDV